jgi:hypothetical protein
VCDYVDQIHLAQGGDPLTGTFEYGKKPSVSIQACGPLDRLKIMDLAFLLQFM